MKLSKEEKEKIEEELEKRTSSLGLMRYAWDFYNSFTILHKEKPSYTDLFPVKYYLLCHALELGTKAYLKEHGYSRRRLREEFGHDIYKLIMEIKDKFGLPMDKTDIGCISSVGYNYSDKDFEYFTSGYKSFAGLDMLADVVKRLFDRLEPIINSMFMERIQKKNQ